MAEIVIAIAAEVAKALVKPAIRQGQYLFCVNKVIRDLDNEKEELMSKMDSNKRLVQQAILRTEIIENSVNKWLNDVDSLLGEVAKLEQDVKESGCFQRWCPTWRRYRLCKEISKKTERITAFKNRGRFEHVSHPAPLPGIEYVCSQNFTYFESTKAAYNELLEALRDDNAYMIGLYGMGGSGKTTLATEVGKKANSEPKLFDQVILVTVSQTPNIESIQETMAERLNFKMEEKSKEVRAQRLWLRLKAENRVLIIVDDVWAKLDLKEIGIRLDDNHNPNFKVLLTTRQRQVCVSMDCQKAILLNLLSKTEGWSLFTKHAGIGYGSPSNLLEVARKVSDECKGLPIAIKAVGSSLKEKGFDEWKVALERLKNPDQFDDNEEEGFTDAFKCLKFSYDYLRNEKTKMLFLMCSMFPEDHEINIEDLIRYGVGLGLSGGCISFDLARSYIREGINKLVDSCLLFYYEKEGHVKMHDVVRDVALCIASKEKDRKILVNLANDLNAFAISSWDEKTNLISYQLDAPRLEILLLQTQNENSLNFSFASSDGVKELKVMSILNSYYDPQPLLLLQSTQWLTNLRILRLNFWKLGDLSFIISLIRLEVLDLQECDLTELPKGMEKLNKLKLLDLSNCELPNNFNYEVLGSFSQLEELYVSSREVKIPSEVIKDIVTLPNLQRFRITRYFNDTEYGESTRVLSLHDFNISDLSASKQNLLQRAEHVSLQGLHGGCENVIPDMVRVVGGMNELTNLCFESCSEIKCLIDTTYGSFQVDTSLPKLVKLQLSEMDNLEEVCRGPPLLVLGFFEKLEQLFIRRCKQLHSIFPEGCNLCNLKILKIGNYDYSSCDWSFMDCTAVVSLFSVSIAQSLQQLEELSIEGCKELKHIITSEGEGGTNTGDNSHLMFPNLKKISENEEPQNLSNTEVCFPKLSELVIKKCDELKSLFSIAMVGMSPQLSTLRISEAAQLEVVFRHSSEYNTDNRDPIMLPSLKNLELEELPSFVNIFEGSNFQAPKLQKLSTCECPKFAPILRGTQGISLPHTEERHVFCFITATWSELCGPRLFAALEAFLKLEVLRETKSEVQGIFHLKVEAETNSNIEWKPLYSNLRKLKLCYLLELRFIWKGLPQFLSLEKLKEVSLVDCPKLKTIFSSDIVKCLPNLWNLSISNCEELEEIISSDSEKTQLGLPSSRPQQEVFFPRLEQIEVKQCNNLKCLFYDSNTCHFSTLHYLTIKECCQLEFGFKIEAGDKSFQREANEDVHLKFSSELCLTVVDCPKFSLTSNESRTSCLDITAQKGQVFWLITTFASLKAFLSLCKLDLTKSRAEGIFQLQVEGETSNNSEWKPWKSNLSDLKLCNLPELRFIWNGFSKFMILENLSNVSLVECPKLKTIFSPNIVKCLPNLMWLSISNCEELEEIISSDSENAQLKPSSSRPKQEVCFPQLRRIEVKQCNKLKCLFYDYETRHFPELVSLIIQECSQLEQAFGFKIEGGDKSFQREACEDGHLILFPELHFLTVMDCPKYRLTSRESSTSCQHVTTQKGQVFWLITASSSLQAFLDLGTLHLTKSRAECIFQFQVEGEISSNNELTPLKSILWKLTLHDLPELRFIWKNFSKFLSFDWLIEVSLVNCPQLKTIFPPYIVRCLPNLQRLLISNCEKLEEIMSLDLENAQLRHPTACPQQKVCFPQLIKIEVKQCNKLKCLFYDSMAYHFPELESLEIEECSQIEQVFGSKGRADDESSQRWAKEDGDRILLPKLRELVLTSLPIFFEISRGFNLSQPMHKYLVTDCPKYNSTFDKASTSYQHTITQGEHSVEES